MNDLFPSPAKRWIINPKQSRKRLPKLSDCRGLPAFGGVAAATRKMTFRYSVLCGMSSGAGYAVRQAIPMGFKF